ncbi:hypothetical protein HYPGJ_10035 [Hyphomicrobium sp. GJ21]|nr:hypothetical protein HYPGJ_10035 [Hyphomicrobium sp. GJ21]
MQSTNNSRKRLGIFASPSPLLGGHPYWRDYDSHRYITIDLRPVPVSHAPAQVLSARFRFAGLFGSWHDGAQPHHGTLSQISRFAPATGHRNRHDGI